VCKVPRYSISGSIGVLGVLRRRLLPKVKRPVAEAVRHVCGKCSHAIVAWSDGNPYYIDEAGAKQYAHHPDHEGLARCIGYDSPHICLSCGHELAVDSKAPITACPKCGKSELAHTYDLVGRPCPYCGDGRFAKDPDFNVIS